MVSVAESLNFTLRRPSGPDRRAWKIRTDDLVVIDVDRVNLKIEPGEGRGPAQLVKEAAGPAYLIVHFPPQSLAEEAYFTTQEAYPVTNPDDPDHSTDTHPVTDDPLGEIPINARIAGWSRLVFIVRDDQLPIEWTIPGILAAIGGLELRVAPNALPPRNRPWWIEPSLDAFIKATAITEAIVESATLATEPLLPGLVVDGLTERVPATRSSPGRVLVQVRDRRAMRTIGYTLGVTDLSGSATVGFVDAVASRPAALPIELIQPIPRAPGPTETALELPYRVILSPNSHAAWFHATEPVTFDTTGHTELWHTRLGVRQTDGTLVDGPDPLRTVRAIWTTDPSPAPDGKVDVPLHSNEPFRTSLDGFDRINVVHLSSNFRLFEPSKRAYEPRPLDVELLALSSLGAWLDSRGAWEPDDVPDGLSVEEWRHRATMGRDHYVRVVYAGRLFPLGHRASLVKVTERRFEGEEPGNPAYLRQMMFIIVREPLRTYRSSGLRYEGSDPDRAGERWDLKFPFTAARITTRVSPLLDKPEDSEIVLNKAQSAFWPFVGQKPFLFHVVATDTSGQSVDLAMPLVFLDQGETDYDYDQSLVPDDLLTEYRSRTWPGSPQLLATVPLGGQTLAFARNGQPDDTSFPVRSVTFDAEVPIKKRYDAMPKRQPRFVPVMRRAQVDVPALQRLAPSTQPATLHYPAPYLANEFGTGNAGEVFLAVAEAADQVPIAFSKQADRSGGFLAPNLSLSGLSRVTGPVSGDIATAIGGSFDPADWFGGLLESAKLFGVLELQDIIGSAPFHELDKLPRIVGDTLDEVGRLVAGIERLRALLTADPVPQAAAVVTSLEQLVDANTGSIPKLLTGGDVGTVVGQLAALQGQISSLPAALQASSLGSGVRAVITDATESLEKALASFDSGLLGKFAVGDILPQAFAARFEWRPVLEPWPKPPTHSIFIPKVDRGLVVSVEAVGDELVVTCALDRFDIDLAVLVLHFDRIQFRSRSGRKPEIDVQFTDFQFEGPLSFIETLRDLIPMDGFSDPPDVTVTAEGITAGFSTGLPNISVGVFSLENLSLAAGFSVPFIGPPMSTWFRFCERENPARLTVSLFGGGFFFGIVVDAGGLQVAEGAFEFGAAVSVNFGVASGSVSAMAGLYFKIVSDDLTLAGYFRLRGEVEALGIISVCIELYLEMLYESKSGKCVGTATISVEVEVAFFSTTIQITTTKKFAGSGADPTLADMLDIAPDMTSSDWNAYCAAFAA